MARWQLKPVTPCRCCAQVWFHEPHVPIHVTDDFVQLYKDRPDFDPGSMQIRYVMAASCARQHSWVASEHLGSQAPRVVCTCPVCGRQQVAGLILRERSAPQVLGHAVCDRRRRGEHPQQPAGQWRRGRHAAHAAVRQRAGHTRQLPWKSMRQHRAAAGAQVPVQGGRHPRPVPDRGARSRARGRAALPKACVCRGHLPNHPGLRRL